ncbi:unnamed protein product [Acanthoscelides obtectus]|uniref:Uncharacterized protein n=1 Tax=Acanthoscelides obtectus TaxID=200917 RepID=A0A9P0NYP9_ACAOB|nr:unnamed protein product [Acanthoscelides obtectus]CAK1649065.1 hypothetical protein AOBTE_LOCUS16015 [Acanthoscelides obtectus]
MFIRYMKREKVSWYLFLPSAYGDRSSKQWVWNDNKRESERTNFNSDSQSDAAGRYDVYEDSRLFAPNNRPLYTEVLPPRPPPVIPERPGNLYLDNNQGSYGLGAGSYHVTNGVAQGVLTAPLPNQVPHQELDRCKCTQKFNCQGIAYGHCDVGKQYCCYSSNHVKPQVGFQPSVSLNPIENGVLVGPGHFKPGYGLENGVLTGPGRPTVNTLHRPPIVGGFHGGNRRPLNGNTYSAANGVLVGPGGPIDRPTYGFARNN